MTNPIWNHQDYDFSARTSNVMRVNRIDTAAEAAALTDQQWLRLPNFGRKSLAEIRHYFPTPIPPRTELEAYERGWDDAMAHVRKALISSLEAAIVRELERKP